MAKHELEKVEQTNMCMIRDFKTNKVLVQVRNKNDWDGLSFPGGHIEKGESIFDSTIRKIKEETGLIIKDITLCGIKNWYDFKKQKRHVVYLFKTDKYTGELIEKSEEGENKWMSIPGIRMSDNVREDFLETLDIFVGKENYTELFYEDTQNTDENKRWVKKIY